MKHHEKTEKNGYKHTKTQAAIPDGKEVPKKQGGHRCQPMRTMWLTQKQQNHGIQLPEKNCKPYG